MSKFLKIFHLPRANSQSLPIIFILVIFLSIVVGLFTQLNRPSLLPSQEQRLDIKELWVVPIDSHCPGYSHVGNVFDVASCLNGIQIGSLDSSKNIEKITIPSVDEIKGNTSPRLIDLLRRDNAEVSIATLLNKRPLAFGFQVPRDKFMPNTLDSFPNMLVISQIVNGRICYLGRCPHATNLNSNPGLQFPLFDIDQKSDAHQGMRDRDITEKFVDVWILADTKISPNALNLSYGIFIAPGEYTRKFDYYLKPIVSAAWIGNVLLIIGICLLAVVTTFFWFPYLEFVSFCLLGVVQLYVATQNIFIMFSTNLHQWLRFDLELLACRLFLISFASIFFAISTLRPNPTKFWRSWIATFVILLGVCFWVIPLLSIRLTKQHLWAINAFIRFFVPPLIVCVGGWRMRKKLLIRFDFPESTWRVAEQRFQEQLLFGICLLISAIPDVVFFLDNASGTYIFDIRDVSAVFLFPLFGALLYRASVKYKAQSESYREELIRSVKKAALVESVQMLAHDIRRPFYLLKIALKSLRNIHRLEEYKQTLQKLEPQVLKSMSSVNNMLEDVMSIQSRGDLVTEALPIENLIVECLKDAFLAWPDADVLLQYRLNNKYFLLIDAPKICRVVTNLLANALEATKGHCTVYFESADLEGGESPWLRLTIGNTGSFIPEAKLQFIFDAFYTSGKSGGTGLGLAVAKKFTEQHGGRISCRSDDQKGTEFVIDLPGTSKCMAKICGPLPRHSSEVFPQETSDQSTDLKVDRYYESSDDIVLIVDDDPFIRDAWETELKPSQCYGLSSKHELENWISQNQNKIDRVSFVIVDFYIDGSPEGIEIGNLCRQFLNLDTKIFLSTTDFVNNESIGIFDAIIDKDPISLESLKKIGPEIQKVI